MSARPGNQAMMGAGQDPGPWEFSLVRNQAPGSLVTIGREGRLTSQTKVGPAQVALTIVDEAVLALVDLALQKGRNLTFVYPAPAGEVAVLLAAQVLLRRLLQGASSQSVGILTSDTAAATRTWEGLGIAAPGSRSQISEVFPCYRALPNGESPFGKKEFRGVLIGRRFANWPVDVVVADHLSGPVLGEPTVPTIRIFADPFDSALGKLAANGELIWGWSGADLAALHAAGVTRSDRKVPFSVATSRLETIATGIRTTIHAVHCADAEKTVLRLRDDLWTLGKAAGGSPSPAVLRGIRIAWHHLSTLTSLPCRPSEFDRFGGVPPIAARATKTFEPEISTWARSLGAELREIVEVLASDLADLRAALEESDPFAGELSQIEERSDTLVIVRTHTAARALLSSLGADSGSDRVGKARVVAIRRLHREGKCGRAVVVGTPSRWDWHRLDSGLTSDLHVLVLGDVDAHTARNAMAELQTARARWAGIDNRASLWRELVGGETPSVPASAEPAREVVVVSARETKPEPDPFAEFESLLAGESPLVGEEGVVDSVAEEAEDGSWRAAVEAVEVLTDEGVILLPRDRLVDVRKEDEILECRADALAPGMFLLVDRHLGRLGLLGAIGERLKRERPDLLAANLLISDLRERVRSAFLRSSMTRSELFEKMRSLGFEKTYQAARGYVDDNGPLAPRDLPDLDRLNQALSLGFNDRRTREVFAAVQRQRTFRRALGRALVAAAHGSVVAAESITVDKDTGLSVADLRELVLEAKVVELRLCPDPRPLTEMGQLKQG